MVMKQKQNQQPSDKEAHNEKPVSPSVPAQL